MQKTITYVISALNEEDLITNTVDEIYSNSISLVDNLEMILVNDGSKDKTGTLMENLAQKYPNVKVVHNKKNKGLGQALIDGLDIASCNYIMLLCGDGGVPGSSLPPALRKIGEVDLVVPYMGNLKKIKTTSRYYLSRIYTKMLNMLFQQDLQYYNGLPIYRVDQLKRLKIISTGFAFQAEIITKLIKSGSSYAQVETLGAEQSNKSVAVSIKGFLEVARILVNLVWEVFIFKPTKSDMVHCD